MKIHHLRYCLISPDLQVALGLERTGVLLVFNRRAIVGLSTPDVKHQQDHQSKGYPSISQSRNVIDIQSHKLGTGPVEL